MKTAIALGGGRRYRYGAALLALVGGALAGACTLDSADRCSPNQVYVESTKTCMCAADTVATATGCVRCGEHEIAGPAGCACEDGFSRASAGAACEPKVDGSGEACDAAAATPCSDPKFSHCEPSQFGSYCTSTGCTASADCPDGFACDTAASPSVCRRPPVGLAKSCTSSADCADSEATYCDTFATHACLVQGCTVAPDNCFEGWDCCDLSQFGVPQPICVAAGGCPK